MVQYLGESVGSRSHAENGFQFINERGLYMVSEGVNAGHIPSRNMVL